MAAQGDNHVVLLDAQGQGLLRQIADALNLPASGTVHDILSSAAEALEGASSHERSDLLGEQQDHVGDGLDSRPHKKQRHSASSKGSEDVSEEDSPTGMTGSGNMMGSLTLEDERTPDQVPKSVWTPNASSTGQAMLGRQLLAALMQPCTLETFQADCFERQPLLVRRPRLPGYFASWLSLPEIRSHLDTHPQCYTRNLDVTSVDPATGKRQNFNYNESAEEPEGGEAQPETVWRRYGQGCSLRLLHPQQWSARLAGLLAPLEEFLQCCVGCNAYLTPPGSQGFAPHFDDIDAFILQVEGSKRWRLHTARSRDEVLPRFSSRDFDAAALGPPVLDAVLRPGDFLYMPRGTVHQAAALPDTQSLHLTLSANQRQTWADMFQLALNSALQLAADDEPKLRRTLPLDFLRVMGAVHSDSEGAVSLRRAELERHAAELGQLIVSQLPLDSAADQMGKAFMQSRLPPAGAGPAGEGEPPGAGSRVRASHPGMARLVVEDGQALVCHCLHNAREAHARGEPDAAGAIRDAAKGGGGGGGGVLAFDIDAAPVLETLLQLSVDEGGGCEGDPGVSLSDLQREADAQQLGINVLLVARVLAREGLLECVGAT